MVKPSQEGETLCITMKIFFEVLAPFHVFPAPLLKVSDPVFKQNPEPVDNHKVFRCSSEFSSVFQKS